MLVHAVIDAEEEKGFPIIAIPHLQTSQGQGTIVCAVDDIGELRQILLFSGWSAKITDRRCSYLLSI